MKFMAVDIRLLKPLDYLTKFLEHGVREDGRTVDSPRSVVLNTGMISTANGSSLVAMGDTKVACGVIAELHSESLEAPGRNYIVCNVEIAPLCSQQLASGPPSMFAQTLSQRLQAIICRCVHKSDLCVDGKLMWVLYVELVCLNSGGNLDDACILAAAAALKNTTLPRVSVCSGVPVVETGDQVSLKVSVLPASVTFTLFNDYVLRDPTVCEELLSSGKVCVTALSNGQLFGVYKTGNPEVSASQIAEMCSVALKLMPRVDSDVKLDFKDVLVRPKRSTLKSRADVNLHREFIFRNSKQKYEGIPVIASNMDTVGTFEMAKTLSEYDLFTTVHKYYTVAEWKQFAAENPQAMKCVAVSSGSGDDDYRHLCDILRTVPEVNYICLDVANGYSEHFVSFVRKTRKDFPNHTLMAGNVVTGEMVEELVLSGADIIKVGIGPGSVCTTRKKTGVGYPQLSAVLECADAAHGLGGHIISDGGCTCPGDVAKAFGAGADYVMLGGMFAGHDQSGGELIEKDGKQYKQFYGMSSSVAMQKYQGGVKDYRASEGKAVELVYRGDVNTTVQDILGGLRSTCTYVGAQKLKELSRRTTFIRVTQQTNDVYK